VGGFTPDDLARIRLAGTGPLYRALRLFQGNPTGNGGHTARLVGQFCGLLDELRRLAGEFAVGDLVQQIYHLTSWRYFSSPGKTGEQVRQNLEQFLDLAHRFSRRSRNELSDFLEYLNLLRESNQPISSIQSGAGVGIRVMSIHAAKGLEFPVVVLANLGRRTNLQDVRRNIVIDRHLTIGLKPVEAEDRSKAETAATIAIKKSIRNKTIAEELRLLYVAMTRAKGKLILSGSVDFRQLGNLVESVAGRKEITAGLITSYTAPICWLTIGLSRADPAGAAALLNSPSREQQMGPVVVKPCPGSVQSGWRWPKGGSEKKLTGTAAKTVDAILKGKQIRQERPDEKAQAILERLNWTYPWRELCSTRAKYPVTELAKQVERFSDQVDAADEMGLDLVTSEDEFGRLAAEDPPAIVKGLAWHRFMEKLDLDSDMDPPNLQRQLHRMIREGYLRADYGGLIDLEKVCEFFRSRPGKIMLKNRTTIWRELPFTYSLPAEHLPEGLSSEHSGEFVLLQGAIDCLIRTPEGLVIIDYKTDQITADQVHERITHHRRQIELYARAVGEILKSRIAAAWLYFTEPPSAVQVI